MTPTQRHRSPPLLYSSDVWHLFDEHHRLRTDHRSPH